MIARLSLCCALVSMALGQPAKPADGEWQSLFDGKSRKGWQDTPFNRRGEVRLENGTLVLGAGGPLTGVNWSGSFPRSDYEVRFEAVRSAGNDFFASLTFPVEDSFCT